VVWYGNGKPAAISSVNQNKLPNTYRWLALVCSVTLILSAGSGVLHILMTFSQKAPPPPGPSGRGLSPGQFALTPAQIASALPEKAAKISEINLRLIAGQPWYIAYTSDSKIPHYIDGQSGVLDDSMDGVFAAQIAREFLQSDKEVKTDYLTSFSGEYINIFRILPLYRFDHHDGSET